jgi:hypothetical protein
MTYRQKTRPASQKSRRDDMSVSEDFQQFRHNAGLDWIGMSSLRALRDFIHSKTERCFFHNIRYFLQPIRCVAYTRRHGQHRTKRAGYGSALCGQYLSPGYEYRIVIRTQSHVTHGCNPLKNVRETVSDFTLTVQ